MFFLLPSQIEALGKAWFEWSEKRKNRRKLKNMNEIWRKEIELGIPFTAPENCTFGFQSERKSFSIWYLSDDPTSTKYIAIGTGHPYPSIRKVVASVCVDGYHVFHLCKI